MRNKIIGGFQMKTDSPFVITISRQLGCGGSYIGKHLARILNIDYVNREILKKAAKELSVVEKELESRDEKLLTFWQSFFHISQYYQEYHLPPVMNFPFDRELFETEEKIIKQIASEHSAVIMGRCGFHILEDHPCHISIFLHADKPFRCERIMKSYQLSEEKALEMIVRSDKEKSHYISTFTGKTWTDARHFNLCVNTGITGIKNSIMLIIDFLKCNNIEFDQSEVDFQLNLLQ